MNKLLKVLENKDRFIKYKFPRGVIANFDSTVMPWKLSWKPFSFASECSILYR